jgi:RNA polymerase sigma factor (sigma-70 family)
VAFERDIRDLLRPALNLAAAMRLDRQDAEDAVQEAALRSWRKRGNRKPGTDLKPWFLAIVANQCRETRRARWTSVLRFSTLPDAQNSRNDPVVSLDLENSLRRLRYPIRLAVVLRYYLDLPFEEVALVSGCSMEAAKSRVRRGLQALAVTLTREDMEC